MCMIDSFLKQNKYPKIFLAGSGQYGVFFLRESRGALCEVVILRQGIFQFEGGALWCQKISKKRLIFKTNFLNPLTLKLPDFKIKTRNEILSFFYFLFCLQNSKLFFLISSYC